MVDWRQAAIELSGVMGWGELRPEVMDYLLEKEEEPWCVCCSGGVDSLSLLLLIYGHFPRKRSGLYVLHYNHKLRGEESDGEI